MSMDMMAPGTTFNITIWCHENTLSKAPTANGASASPILPPMPCKDKAKPLRSGNIFPRRGIAVGCHKLLPIPTNIAHTSSIQYVLVNPIKK